MRNLHPIQWRLLAGLGAAAFAVSAASARAFDQNHAKLDKVLHTYVNDQGMVDYDSLRKNRGDLDDYLKATAAVSESEFNGWSESKRLAFLINVYNAETLQLIIDHYPVKSIKKIGSLFGTPWDVKCVSLFGETTTLNAVEQGILRKKYHEPRIHFALVCAAMGCPPLRNEVYVADELDAQLTSQAKKFLGQSNKNRIEGDTLYLSTIFRWYGGDFTATGKSVPEFIAPFMDGDPRGKKIKYTDYDWNLNRQ